MALLEKLKSQTDKIELFDRLNKASTSFIEDLCSQCHCFLGIGFKIWLKNRLNEHIRMFGLNDWRTAAISAVLNSSEVDYSLFKTIAKNAEALIPGP